MPQTNVKSRWVDGDLYFYDASGNEIARFDGTNRRFFAVGGAGGGVAAVNIRVRRSVAEINAGAELLPAVAGYKWRLVDATLIAIGGNAATATSVDVQATQAASGVTLIAAAVAALTRSTVVKPNTASVTVLADGASFVQNDAGTAINCGKTGGSLATATHVDFIITAALEP